MLKCIGLTALATAVAVLTLGCVRGPLSPTAPVRDQIYMAKPMSAPAGIISSEATDGIEWVDPGQEAIHAIDVAFPAEALKARKLTTLRLEIGYVSSPYREEMVSFAVSIGSQ